MTKHIPYDLTDVLADAGYSFSKNIDDVLCRRCRVSNWRKWRGFARLASVAVINNTLITRRLHYRLQVEG